MGIKPNNNAGGIVPFSDFCLNDIFASLLPFILFSAIICACSPFYPGVCSL